MAGFVTLYIPEGLTTTVTDISMLHAEAIHGPPENHSSVYHHYRAKETNVYTTKGDGAAASYTPLFTYAGFRYMQLTGYPGTPDFKPLTAHFIHTDYELTGSISFSDPMLDAVQHITRTAAMSNFQSIPTDCPQREVSFSCFCVLPCPWPNLVQLTTLHCNSPPSEATHCMA